VADHPLQPLPIVDPTLPAMPPRSRLYPLAPLGVGTPEVESLTSYLNRLANAHCVPLTKLAELEFAPLLNKSISNTRTKFNYGAKTLNGGGDWTANIITLLERLTYTEGLRCLTLNPWRNVLAREKLLRSHLAWCPACYTAWQQAGQPIYNPLLWYLDVAEICYHHHLPLQHHCPHPDCQQQLPLINNRSRPGYCPFCHQWLGIQCTPVSWSEATWSWQRWVINQLGQLVTAASQLPTDPQPQMVAQNLIAYVEMSKSTYVSGLAREVGMSSSPLYGWINHARPPRLDLLARICYHLDRSLLEVLSTRVEGFPSGHFLAISG